MPSTLPDGSPVSPVVKSAGSSPEKRVRASASTTGSTSAVSVRRTVATLATALLAATVVLTGGPADAATTARVLHWVDGDTVETTRGTVRLIGIDTPESG